MELDFLRIFATLFNMGLIILIVYLVIKVIKKIISSMNALNRIEDKLNEISESLKGNNKQS
ncbi:hypothetical protein GNF80_12470 [Clostridium perfringens]|nr:hypothetical protein [Clostridium perfringens]